MKKKRIIYLDFQVDKLTKSIENVKTGDGFQTEVSLLTHDNARQVNKRSGWLFDWNYELNQNEREVYKLTIVNNPNIIQGLVSLSREDDHIYMHLIESAPFNRGREKIYSGVPGNLVAFVCRISFQMGFDGFISFHAKTKLIDHYIKTLGAYHFGAQLMIINTAAANNLVERYFKT